MIHPAIALIEQRVSANRFDATHELTDRQISELVRLATLAPTAYNLQNWRFIAVRVSEAKLRLQRVAHGQEKVAQAAVTFIVCGVLPFHADVPRRLSSFVEAGFMTAATASGWQEGARAQYADLQVARDEAVRSATLGAATLMYAAEAMGYVSGPMVGFDPAALVREFGLGPDEVPVMLVAIGRAAPGNWPQKPRRPLAEVLHFS